MASSSAADTATKTLEELQAELSAERTQKEALLREKESLRQSVHGLSQKTREQEELLRTYQAMDGTGTNLGMSKEEVEALVAASSRKTVEELLKERDDKAQAALDAVREFNATRSKWLAQAAEEMPASVKPDSPLYKKAMEIFRDPTQGLSVVEGQTLKPTSAQAEYLAFSAAERALAKERAAKGDTTGATFGATGGSQSSAPLTGTKEMSDAEFLAMTPDQRIAWQKQQVKV